MKKATIILSVLLLLSIMLNGILFTRQKARPTETSDTTTCVVVHNDTIPYLMPVAKDSVVVRYVVKQMAINRQEMANNCHDTTNICQDTASAIIPITQKTYSDSTYTAWVSGYEAQLDSIKVYQHTKTIYNTVTERRKIPPWDIGITAGYGIGKGGLTPYFGVGITYRLFSIGKRK